MYANADQFPDGTTLGGFDICIVGAGAAGIAMAKRLIGSSKKVLLITSGLSGDKGAPDSTTESLYQGTLGPFMQKVDPIFLTRSRLRMYGGTTNHFGFWARPEEAADLQPRPGYRDASWPIDIEELNRYYPDANTFGNFGAFNYNDIAFWSKALYGHPFPSRPDDRLKNAIFHAQYDATINNFQVHYGDDLRAAQNLTVLFNANALTIDTTAQKEHVLGLSCATIAGGKPGARFRVEAGAYVLALGGIETVRLLKLSGDLGDNARGHLGRGFMVHPLITQAANVRFAQPVDIAIQSFFYDHQVKIRPPQHQDDKHTLISAPVFHPGELDDLLIFNAWGTLMPTPQTLHAEKIGNFRTILTFNDDDHASINLNWEQVPNENSTITLDASQTDPVFGQPVVRLDWNMLDQEKRTIIRALELCKNYLEARGAVGFEITTDLSGGPENWTFGPTTDHKALAAGDHHMGALRMSKTPEDGILNPDLMVHTVDNLYVASCAAFPTSGCANPTLTIVALALRLADHLNNLGQVPETPR